MSYVAQVNQHFVEHGLDGLFYFTTREDKWINVVLAHPQVTRKDVQAQYFLLGNCYLDVANYANHPLPSDRFNMYDKMNSLWSASVLLILYPISLLDFETSCLRKLVQLITRVLFCGCTL